MDTNDPLHARRARQSVSSWATKPARTSKSAALAELAEREPGLVEGGRVVDQQGEDEVGAERRERGLGDVRLVDPPEPGHELVVDNGRGVEALDGYSPVVVDPDREEVAGGKAGEPAFGAGPTDVPGIEREHLDDVVVARPEFVTRPEVVAPGKASEIGADAAEYLELLLRLVVLVGEDDPAGERDRVDDTVVGEGDQRAAVESAVERGVDDDLCELVSGATEPLRDLVAQARERDARLGGEYVLRGRDDVGRSWDGQPLEHRGVVIGDSALR